MHRYSSGYRPIASRADVYLNADWTYDRFSPTYRMEYNEADHSYHATVLLNKVTIATSIWCSKRRQYTTRKYRR